MRLCFLLTCCLCVSLQFLRAQTAVVWEEGAASYVSSLNVYVKFSSTESINKGDTLFTYNGTAHLPALVVKDKSSTSCVCTALLKEKVKAGDKFYFPAKTKKENPEPKPTKTAAPKAAVAVTDSNGIQPPPVVRTPVAEDKEPEYRQRSKGRVSVASYSTINGGETSHRMRYTFTHQGENIGNSRFSTDAYVAFRHTIGQWEAVKSNFSDALKVYAFSLRYRLDQHSWISVGRRINNRISSMGAIDGLQMEKRFGKMYTGAILGSRPDFSDFSINLNLQQAGAYVGWSGQKDAKQHESTLALIEQRNHFITDRRFVYFQHSNTLFENLSLFSSFEVDLYQKIAEKAETKVSLTNLLLSLRYRINRNLSLSAAYDNRRNVIFYESYKNYIDQLIDNETRQGLRFGANWRVHKFINLGVNSSWRFQSDGANASENLNAYLNFSQIPRLKMNLSISANLLKTNYLNSSIFGARLGKSLAKGRLNTEVYYRNVGYNYAIYENQIRQHICGADFSWNITRKTGLYLYYEGTFGSGNAGFTRVNSRIIQRF